MVDWVKPIAFPDVSGPHSTHTRPEKLKNSGVQEDLLSLPDCLQAGTLAFSYFRTHTLTGAYTIGFPGSRAFRLRLKLYHCSSGSPACQLQVRGLRKGYKVAGQEAQRPPVGDGEWGYCRFYLWYPKQCIFPIGVTVPYGGL